MDRIVFGDPPPHPTPDSRVDGQLGRWNDGIEGEAKVVSGVAGLIGGKAAIGAGGEAPLGHALFEPGPETALVGEAPED